MCHHGRRFVHNGLAAMTSLCSLEGQWVPRIEKCGKYASNQIKSNCISNW